MPLEGLALQVKLLRPRAPVAAFLAAMMEPPSGEARRPGRRTLYSTLPCIGLPDPPHPDLSWLLALCVACHACVWAARREPGLLRRSCAGPPSQRTGGMGRTGSASLGHASGDAHVPSMASRVRAGWVRAGSRLGHAALLLQASAGRAGRGGGAGRAGERRRGHAWARGAHAARPAPGRAACGRAVRPPAGGDGGST